MHLQLQRFNDAKDTTPAETVALGLDDGADVMVLAVTSDGQIAFVSSFRLPDEETSLAYVGNDIANAVVPQQA